MPWLVWTAPWALLGLVAVPVLVAIYWLRFRYRPVPVSTLLFWRDVPELREAGIRWERLHLPLLFFLELLVILLLVGAALGLHVLMPDRSRPLIVILDDSLSMQAGQPSARQQAEQALRELLRQHRFAAVRLLLAGPTPQWLGHAVQDVREVESLLRHWQCLEPTAALDRALATAREWGGREALLLVLTDAPPEVADAQASFQWWAFGSAQTNLAITHAVRTATPERDRMVLEVANFSTETQSTTLSLRWADNVLQSTPLTLLPGESQTLHYTVPAQASVIEASLPQDALEWDNRVWLVHHTKPTVRVHVEVSQARLRSALEKALQAAGQTVFDRSEPHVLITDNPARRPTETTWLVQLVLEKEGEAFTGPFLLDQQHPLCEGLSLLDVIWGSRRDRLEGIPIITVADIPLVTETVHGWERRHLRLRLIPELTTWPRSPDWPIFWANLVHWRRSEFPGPATVHARLGDVLRMRSGRHTDTSSGESFVRCRFPDGREERFVVRNRQAFVPLRQLGVHEILVGEQTWLVAVNMSNRAESDLRSRASGRWGQWHNEEILRQDYRDLTWVFLLAALAVLLLHGWLAHRSGSSS
ncbi:MAG: BatA and WFA domain-containing protein [Gemmatales bacterium]|nr:BatA and WFA domain-containing protein [Gemmatales bacterium]MDW7993843.1 BatA and WFA domain-containing protein [Gemmatales bacterium]